MQWKINILVRALEVEWLWPRKGIKWEFCMVRVID